MPVVSVIIPIYNARAYLSETLKSVQDQTYKDWECIVVENGSSDESMKAIREISSRDGRFTIVPLVSFVGVASSRNIAMQRCYGKYILFLDAGNRLAPGYLEAAVNAMEEDPSLHVVYGKAERVGKCPEWDLPPFSMSMMLSRNCLYISSLFRKSEHDLYMGKGFDTQLDNGFEDWDFWLSLFEALPQEPNVRQLEEVCFYYTEKGMHSEVSDEDLKAIRLQLWEKHKALYARYFLDPCETLEYQRLLRAGEKGGHSWWKKAK